MRFISPVFRPLFWLLCKFNNNFWILNTESHPKSFESNFCGAVQKAIMTSKKTLATAILDRGCQYDDLCLSALARGLRSADNKS